ncbi:LysR family transcriptional regulator [Limosilactobacillus fermentum]|uniref:LysR family transcriptional regulator n=1 Tax=Limosilactobacillus fermentum TaxID=1613 RepID=UPI0009BBD010|nr:LysR family transcriptional regulator [Limosilactobacillus fermentum]
MKQINKLEQELGVALFTRTSTGVTLTPAGKSRQGLQGLRRTNRQLSQPGPGG